MTKLDAWNDQKIEYVKACLFSSLLATDWELALLGKNLTDEYYWYSAVPAFDTGRRYPGRPAEYGIRAAYRF